MESYGPRMPVICPVCAGFPSYSFQWICRVYGNSTFSEQVDFDVAVHHGRPNYAVIFESIHLLMGVLGQVLDVFVAAFRDIHGGRRACHIQRATCGSATPDEAMSLYYKITTSKQKHHWRHRASLIRFLRLTAYCLRTQTLRLASRPKRIEKMRRWLQM